MFEELRRILGDTGQLEEQEDLLDILWLATRIPSGPAAPLAGAAPYPPARDTGSPSSDSHPEQVPDPLPGVGAEPAAGEAEPAGQQSPYLPVVSGPFADGTPDKALWAPAARAVGPTLPLGRALRPLKRRVASRRHHGLDEVATADLQADTRTPQVVLRHRSERWLRLALIIDDGVSMLLWERQWAELKQLFERSGAFRQVDTYQIRYGSPGAGAADAVRLGRPWSTSAATRPAGSLMDVSGRTMVLVVTDGAAAGWGDGRLRPVLEAWARRGPTAVLHTLPRRLWAGSGVGADTWQVTSPRPGAPNTAWTVTDPVLPPSVAPPPPVPVPVLELGPADFATWAAVNTVVGRPVPVRLWTPHRVRTPADGPGRVSVRDFGRAASPEAVRLAAHLAAMAPVTVPVMQLVHSCLDDGQGAAPLAEVLLGGLVQPLPPPGDARLPGRHRLFDFTPEAKDLLLDAVPTAELLACSRLVGRQIESLLGHASGFPAWPLGPDGAATATPFAYLGPGLQARMGLAPPHAAERTVVPPSPPETSAWVSNEGLAASVRVLCEALGRLSPGWAEGADLPPVRLAGYVDGTDLPDWGFVVILVNLLAGHQGKPPVGVWARLRAQYVEALLPRCPAQVQLVFERARVTQDDADLLLLHLLLYLHTRTGRAGLREEEIVEDLSGFLAGRGLRLERESPRGPWDVRRHDLLWPFDGGHCLVEVRRTRSPFDWPGVMLSARSLGMSAAVAGFLLAVDEDEHPTGPVPLDECVVAEPTDGGPVVGLRFQNGSRPVSQTGPRVCVVVDTPGSGRQDETGQRSRQEALWWVLDHALRAAGVSRDACVRQDRGDGAIVVLPQGVDEARAVPGFVDGLAQALGDWPLRLRVAMDLGVVEVAEPGVTGDAVLRASRLVGSAHLRERGSPYTLIVSEPLYDRAPALAGRFERVRVDLKDYRAWAWLQREPADPGNLPALPDRARSRAVLVGSDTYAELDDLPQVRTGLEVLADLLTDPSEGGFALEHTSVLRGPVNREAMLRVIGHAATSAEETLLVYFAGHVLRDVRGELGLAVYESRPDVPYSALPFDQLRDLLRHSAARHKIVILDCCYSGSAGLPTQLAEFSDDSASSGITVLTADASSRGALAPPGSRYTAFTGALIDVLSNGLADGPDAVSVSRLFQEARSRLAARALPLPMSLSVGLTDEIALARNRAR